MADDESQMESQEEPQADENEARKAMGEAQRKHQEKQQQEMIEYEEMRRAEREKEIEDIRLLRERREQRKKEREQEEIRISEFRAQEEVRRKAEEEIRRKKKAEDEARAKEDKERKKKEAEERLKPKKPNFVIQKRSDAEKASGSLDPMNAEDMQKSKEQLEEEKQAILAQRIQPLQIEGMMSDKLLIKGKELNETIRRLEGDKYDLEQRFKRQQYDMIELAERARQMNKGKAKRGVSTVQVDESFDRLADKFTSAPPKIQLCSKYERHTDHRTYVERHKLFEDLAIEPPPPEIVHVPGYNETDQEESEQPAAE